MIRAYFIHHFTTYMHWIMYSTVHALNNAVNVAIGESHLDQVACEFHAKASEVFQDIFDLETVCPSPPRRLVACRHNATGPSRPSAWVAGLEPRCPGPSVGSGEGLLSASRR